MRDFKDIDKVVGRVINGIKIGTQQAVSQASQELADEVKMRVSLPPEATLFPIEWDKHRNADMFPIYVASIKSATVSAEGETVKGGAYSDFLVLWEKYNTIVPFGMFIEWGTGAVGSRTVSTPFVNTMYQYSLFPWDKATSQQDLMFGEFGLSARPHWYPASRSYAPKLQSLLTSKIAENING